MSDVTSALFADLRQCGERPLDYGQETHGELHLDALAELERLTAALVDARKPVTPMEGDAV